MHGRQEAWKGALLLRLTENAHTMGCPFGPEDNALEGSCQKHWRQCQPNSS